MAAYSWRLMICPGAEQKTNISWPRFSKCRKFWKSITKLKKKNLTVGNQIPRTWVANSRAFLTNLVMDFPEFAMFCKIPWLSVLTWITVTDPTSWVSHSRPTRISPRTAQGSCFMSVPRGITHLKPGPSDISVIIEQYAASGSSGEQPGVAGSRNSWYENRKYYSGVLFLVSGFRLQIRAF